MFLDPVVCFSQKSLDLGFLNSRVRDVETPPGFATPKIGLERYLKNNNNKKNVPTPSQGNQPP